MDLFLFSGFNRFMHFLSTYANSWIKIAVRRTLFDPVWFPVGIRRWVGPGMALTTIGEVPQWGGVADWSSCRTPIVLYTFDYLPFIDSLQMNFTPRIPNFWTFIRTLLPISWIVGSSKSSSNSNFYHLTSYNSFPILHSHIFFMSFHFNSFSSSSFQHFSISLYLNYFSSSPFQHFPISLHLYYFSPCPFQHFLFPSIFFHLYYSPFQHFRISSTFLTSSPLPFNIFPFPPLSLLLLLSLPTFFYFLPFPSTFTTSLPHSFDIFHFHFLL